MTKTTLISAAIVAALSSTNSYANDDLANIERITITAPQFALNTELATEQAPQQVDIANWLSSVPGANINRNGPLTGIAQFRGLFGDRVAVQLNNHPIIGAGPNAMDTPLSYSGNLMVESMTVYQGIAPVSAAINSLAGAIEVTTKHAEVEHSEQVALSGLAQANFASNTQGKDLAVYSQISQGNHALLVHANRLTGDDYQSAEQTITPSQYDKNIAGLDYRYQAGDLTLGFSYQNLATQNTGTAPLPMDIKFIYADQFQAQLDYQFATWQLNAKLGYMDNRHAMDNYSLRPLMNANMARRNNADANTLDVRITLENDAWLLGFDGYSAEHNSTITNKNNAMFEILNFNRVLDNQASLFAQWHGESSNQWQINTGIRVKHAVANADNISHSMSSQMPMLAMLAQRFNSADKSQADTNIDLSFTAKHPLTDTTTISLGLGVKQRAPSYQERYLWLPMEATGGLADGNTYIGNVNLDSETAYQSDLGVEFQADKLMLSSHLFYQKINDYIQGTATDDMAVNMVASMMSTRAPLTYTNVDAILYGLDGRASYQLSAQLQAKAQLSFVRGKRDDINDNLYRVAPLNIMLGLNYYADNWQADVNVTAYAKQNKVSVTNLEQATAGYALINANFSWDINNQSQLTLGIENLLDKNYTSHLAGYNRVMNNGLAVFERLPQMGRNIFASLRYQF